MLLPLLTRADASVELDVNQAHAARTVGDSHGNIDIGFAGVRCQGDALLKVLPASGFVETCTRLAEQWPIGAVATDLDRPCTLTAEGQMAYGDAFDPGQIEAPDVQRGRLGTVAGFVNCP